jgi:hypothetical protein
MLRYKPNKILVPKAVSTYEDSEIGWQIPDTFVTWDGGNGNQSAWRLFEGELQYFSLPNVRVPVTGYSLNTEVSGIGTNEMVYADVAAGRFGIGDKVWEGSKYPPETFVNSEERYGSEIHIFMLLCLLAALNAPEDTPLTIIASAPPGLVNKVAKTIKTGLRMGEAKDKSGSWTIQMSYDKKPRTFVIGKVIVVPEGIPAFCAYAYDTYGKTVQIPSTLDVTDDSLTGQVHIHDAGQGTYDTYIIRNGQIDAESLSFATDPNAGILRQMVEPIMDYVRDQFVKIGQPMPNLTSVQVDSWLRDWVVGKMNPKFSRVKLHGRILELQGIFETRCARYAEHIIQHKLANSFARGADTVLLVGGAWSYTLDHIRKHYPNKNILWSDKVPHLKGIPMWELNAYGGLPFIAANQRVHQKANEG